MVPLVHVPPDGRQKVDMVSAPPIHSGGMDAGQGAGLTDTVAVVLQALAKV